MLLAFAQVDHHREAYWVIIGLVFGLIAAAIVRRGAVHALVDVVVGVVGAVAGGLILHAAKHGGLHTLPRLWEDAVAAAIGALVLLLILEVLSHRRADERGIW